MRQIYATFKAANQQIHRNSSSDTNVDFNNEEINTDLANAFPQGEKKFKSANAFASVNETEIHIIILEFRKETDNL